MQIDPLGEYEIDPATPRGLTPSAVRFGAIELALLESTAQELGSAALA